MTQRYYGTDRDRHTGIEALVEIERRADGTMHLTAVVISPGTMRDFEVRCSCGNRWRLEAESLPEAIECTACGAHTSDVDDLGELRR